MHVTKENLSPTKVKLAVEADQATLTAVKQEVLEHLAKDHVKVQGFRSGKAPLSLIEKQVDPNLLQSEFIDKALNQLYGQALDNQKLRPVDQPQVNITKFVPFTTLEFTAEVEVVGEIKLPDYTKMKLARRKVTVNDKDIDEVVENLRGRIATKAEITRAAKNGDEIVIDFQGTDAKTKKPINGTDGKDFPLTLGSNAFIPGFEEKVVGVKAGDDTTFDVTFPKDYSVSSLQSKKVTFAVTVKKVNEVVLPKVDAAFAAQVGSFKTVAEMRDDIKKQVQSERDLQSERDYQNQLLEQIAEKTKAEIPKVLVDNEIDRMEQEERQNLVYRGQTWQEHLDAEGVDDEQHRENLREAAALRVKSGLMLAEIADKEGIAVTPKELDARMEQLKAQYTDPQMQQELNTPAGRRDIASRLISEKTIVKLSDYASAK